MFSGRMGVFNLEFTTNFPMNLMHHLRVTTAAGVGGRFARRGEEET